MNSLEDSELYVRLMTRKDGHRVTPQFDIRDELSFDADIDMTDRAGWRQRTGEKRFFTSPQLADTLLKRLLAQVRARVQNADY